MHGEATVKTVKQFMIRSVAPKDAATIIIAIDAKIATIPNPMIFHPRHLISVLLAIASGDIVRYSVAVCSKQSLAIAVPNAPSKQPQACSPGVHDSLTSVADPSKERASPGSG